MIKSSPKFKKARQNSNLTFDRLASNGIESMTA
jgi:hypothetical protein